MQSIVDFIAKNKQYIVLCLLSVICLSLMSLGGSSRLAAFRTLVVGGIGIGQEAFSWIQNPVALRSENKILRELNYTLSREVTKTRQVLIENQSLRALLEFKKKSEYEVIPADVVGKVTAEMRNYITLNSGKKSGIADGMSVVTDRGLVGHVIGTTDNYTLIQSILNRDTRIAVKVERNHIEGIVVWEGGEQLLLKNISRSLDVRAGDILVTSGFSTLFPSGIQVGRVTAVKDQTNSLFRVVTVAPSVNFSTIEQVFVNKYLPNPEELILRKKLEEKLANKR